MRDFNPSQGFKPPERYLDNDWPEHEQYWRANWRSRPYAAGDLDFEFYRPAYQYGHQSAQTHRGRMWEDVREELRSGWDRYEHRGNTAWERIEQAVQDGWRRVAETKR